jgi:dTDP-4-amino-4,6-dideoxygalactose transaminase
MQHLKVEVAASMENLTTKIDLSSIRDEELASAVDLAESELARAIGRDAVLVSSGLTALEIALQSAGVKPGDQVVCDAAYPFAGLAVRNVGAVPLFIDVDPNRDRLVIDHRRFDRLRAAGVTVAIFTAYFGDVWSYRDARERWVESGGLAIEDRAQAFEPVELGSTSWITYSFQSGKLLSCGQGGAISPPAQALGTCRRLRALGWWPRNEDTGSQWTSGWQSRGQGRSARLAPIAALLLSGRLRHLEEIRASLRESAHKIMDALVASNAAVLGRIPEHIGSRLTGVLVPDRTSRMVVEEALKRAGAVVGLAAHPPVNEWPAFLTPGSPSLPWTIDILSRLLCVPLKAVPSFTRPPR